MFRRFGTLGVGALLTLSLGTGCVTTSDYLEDPPPHAGNTLKLHPLPPPAGQPQLTVPTVVTQAPPKEPPIVAPSPPPIPPIQRVTLTQPPPDQPPAPFKDAGTPGPGSESPILTALRGAIEKHPAEVFEALKKGNYDKRTQEVLVAMLPLTAHLSEGGLEKMAPQEREMLVELLNHSVKLLQTKTSLSIEKVCYCRRIRGYGLYDPLPDNYLFAAGVEKKHGEFVELYVEARNFVNRHGPKSYEVALAGIVEIYDKQNLLVWRHDFPADADHSQSPRQDYFMNYQFWVPPLLEPGEYKLKVSLCDTNAPGKDANKWSVPREMEFHVQGNAARTADGLR